MIDEMNGLKVLVETQANAREIGQAQQGRTSNAMHFAELLKQSKEIGLLAEQRFGYLERAATYRQRQQVIKWLSAADAGSDQDHHRGYRNKIDSGHWILRDKRFQAWADQTSDSAPLLWVTGIPGAGNHHPRSTRQLES
jgi:hypothetical protein